MTADGTEVRQLTDNDDHEDGCPVWSPDGDSIAFTSYSDGFAEIFIMNSDGTQVRQVTDAGYDMEFVLARFPVWSPDGDSIAFVGFREHDGSGFAEIFVMNADGTEVRQLTDNDYDDEYPVWSPDGDSIAFHSDRRSEWVEDVDGDETGVVDIFVMNADGTQEHQLTDNDDWVMARFPVWSPDGDSIVFHSYSDGDAEIFVMNADGTQVRQLTDNDNVDELPVWSPDGDSIAFTSDRDGDYEIFVMNADGTDVYSTGQQGSLGGWRGPAD
jgi:TolB protein